MAYYTNTAVDFSKKEFNENNTTKIDHKLLKNLLGIQSPSKYETPIIKFVVKFIKDLKDPNISIEMDKSNNLLITKGESELYPCFVAHMDSVNAIQSDRTIIRLNNCYIGMNLNTGEYSGVDGDDKCGIYICLEALRRYQNVKIALFISEEIGCIGSNAVNLSFFSDCSFIFQADRKGDDEVIKHTNGVITSTDEFMDLCKPVMDKYKYKFGTGTSTDVGTLIKREVGCCGFNFGSGYFQPHSLEEKICISSLENCMNLMFDLADRALQENKRFAHVPPKFVATARTYPGSYGSRYYGQDWEDDVYNDYYPSYNRTAPRPIVDNRKDKRSDNIYCTFCNESTCVDCPFKKCKEEEEEENGKTTA